MPYLRALPYIRTQCRVMDSPPAGHLPRRETMMPPPMLPIQNGAALVVRRRPATGESLVSPVSRAFLGNQLDKLLHSCWLPGRWVQRVWILSDLPLPLERRARAVPPGAIWRAYTDGARLWFATAAAVDSASYRPSVVAIEVLFFENDGLLCCGGIWSCDPRGDWRLEKPIDTSARRNSDWPAQIAGAKRAYRVAMAVTP
jgi:hypothetical protein